jgi:hypothetical protein
MMRSQLFSATFLMAKVNGRVAGASDRSRDIVARVVRLEARFVSLSRALSAARRHHEQLLAAIRALEREARVQFQRIAQVQAEVDALKRGADSVAVTERRRRVDGNQRSI